MVAIFTGTGFGLGRASASTLGATGLLGDPSQGRSGDGISVNATTGNLLIQKQDEFLVGHGPDASVSRSYNSLTWVPDDNNDRWRQSTDRRIMNVNGTPNSAGSYLSRVSEDGSYLTYGWNGSVYINRDGGGAYDTIVKSGSEWVWTDGDTGTVERYADDATGRLKSVTDNVGTTMSFAYDAAGRLSTITTNDGSWIRYDWIGSTKNIAQIVNGFTDLSSNTSKTLTRTRYGYDGANRLSTVTVDLSPQDNAIGDGNTYVTTYGYDGSNRIGSITQSDGSAMSVAYDGSGKVTSLVQTVASGVTRTTSLAYYSGYTLVTDASGQVTRLDYNSAGHLTTITAPPATNGETAQVWQFTYNSVGDVLSTTDPQGRVTTYANFTANGIAQTVTDRTGAVTTRTFDATNHLLSETANGVDSTGAQVSQTTRYAYNAAGDLRFVISAEGRVTEYVRNAYGAVTSEIAFNENSYTAGGIPSEATMANWAAGSWDKSGILRVDHSYDARMARVKSTSYALTSSGGAGLTSQGTGEVNYVYDQAGSLLSRYAGGQSATTYVYDGLGRLVGSTDAAGQTTSIVFDDANTKTTITTSGGRTTVQTYNRAGDLIQQSDSGSYTPSTTTSYAVDRLGRTRVTTFANSADKLYDLYDPAGRHVASVDGAGRITEYRYDGNDRMVGTIAYRNAVSSGYFATLDDPNNTLSVATIRPATDAQDVSGWTIYDAEGRVLQTIAGDGSTVISTYDAAGRLQRTTGYVNKVAAATVAGFVGAAPTVVITPTAHANDITKRWFYDRDGRVIGTIDGERHVVRNTYDQAGQLVATTAFANATTAANPTMTSFDAIVGGIAGSAQDRTTRNVYDGRGLLRFAIDGLGNVTRYDYDDAGLATRTVTYATPLGALSDYTFDNVLAQLSGQETGTSKRVSYAVYDAAGRLAYSIAPLQGASDMAVTGYAYDVAGNVVRTTGYAATAAISAMPGKAAMDSWAAASANGADRITRMWYTGRNQPAYRVDAEGAATRFDYDARGRAVSETIWHNRITVGDGTTLAQVEAAVGTNGYTTNRIYDSLGRVTRLSDATGSYTVYAYLGATNLVSGITRAAGGSAQEQATRTNVFDGAGRIIQATDAAGTSEAASRTDNYDGRGVVTSTVDARSTTTSYTYDLDGRVRKVTDANGGVVTYDYNAFGEAWKVTDKRGNASYSWYDRAGRVTTTRDAQDYLTTTSYTAFGEIAAVKRWAAPVSANAAIDTEATGSGAAATTQFTYDKAGRVITSVDALGQTESYGYTNFRERRSVTNRLGNVTNYSVDRLGRTVRESTAATTANIDVNGTASTGAQNVDTYTYDTRGNVTAHVEGFSTSEGGAVTALRTTSYAYDAASRLVRTTHDTMTVIADDMVTTSTTTPIEEFAYDQRGNVIKATDRGGAQTFSYYDDLDRKTVEIRQTGAATAVYTAFVYDKNGNVVTTRVYDGNVALPGAAGGTDPAAPSGTYRQTDFAFDNLGRMTSRTVVSVSGNAIASGSWNGSGYVQSSGNLVTRYSYDSAGNLIQVTDPNGVVTTNWYDLLGRKTGAIDGEGYLTRWTYNAEGLVLGEVRYATRFTGTVSTASPPAIGTSAADRETIYTYDLNGNRLTEKRTNVAAFTVDAQTGALSAAGTDAVISYTYNALGQVTVKKVDGQQTAAYFYDEAGHLTYESKGFYADVNGSTVAPGTSYEYDALGNLTLSARRGSHNAISVDDRVTTYRFANGGHLVAMIDAEGFAHQYSYDAAGRLKKDAYNRLVNADANASSGAVTTVAEAKTATYDLGGRMLSQSIYSTVGSTFKRIGVTNYQYNNFDQVTQQGIGTNSASDIAAGSALYQIANQYDGAGRLVGTNSGDGVWKFFGYDAAGNQTAAVTSAGASFSASTGFATALSQAGNANVNATYTTYDKRNLATSVIEEGRDLSGSVTGQTLTTSRSYNGFGDIAAETDALGNTITYAYNNMGRRTRTEGPGVQVTNENGATNWIRPSEDNYYDLGGRLIATRDANGSYAAGSQGAPASKAANTGNLTTWALLAGTGYDGTASLVSTEFHADGGRKETLYDRMGDARVIRDELYAAGAPNLHVTEQRFDRLGHLVEVKHNRQTNVADDSTRLIDTYGYDQFGQRLLHRTNANATTLYEKSDYDGLGRTSRQVDFSNFVTTTSYGWDGTLATAGMGTFGGFVTTTTAANGRTSIVKNDIFNHETFRKDLGNHQSTSSYDAGGRQLTRGDTSYGWYNTGLVASIGAVTSGSTDTDTWTRQVTTYGYDRVGRRIAESLSTNGSRAVRVREDNFYYWDVSTFSEQLTNQTASYDALGRLTTMNEAGTSTAPATSIARAYDAAGNIRNTVSTHAILNHNGVVTSNVTDSFWYRYDGMNRLVTDRGMLSGAAGAAGTTIVRTATTTGNDIDSGKRSTDYVYDLAGQRVAALRTDYTPEYYYGGNEYYDSDYFSETREMYDYDGAGRLKTIRSTQGANAYGNGTSTPPAYVPAAPTTGGATLSAFGYDLAGRQTSQLDYQGNGTVVYSRTASYAANGALTSDSTSTLRYDNATYQTSSTYSYYGNGEYLLGAIGSVTTANSKNGSYQNSSSTVNSYVWWDSAVQSAITQQPNTGSSTTYTTTFATDYQGRITSASINDGRPRTVTYRTNAEGQVIRRDENDNNYNSTTGGDPHEVWYRFAGVELGYVGNNGTTQTSTAASISNRRVNPPTGAFRNGGSYASAYSDFSQSPDVINAYEQGSAAGGFTARAGDTLRSIAQQLWGDSSLWYKLAEANGIQGDMALAEGQRLNVPPGVVRSSHNAATFRPYDAAEATGNLSPTQPQPSRRNGCGAFGQILLAAIAIAVTVIALPAGGLAAGLTGIGQGALAGAAGSVASQAVGLATGIQDKFDFKGLAMSAIAGGVGAGLGGVSGLDKIAGSATLGSAARGALGSVITQGIGVATGLQDRFSWAGVAAAGVGAGAGRAAFGAMKLTPLSAQGGRSLSNIAGNVVSGAAGALASAATRSALDGSSFGDNVLRGLPDVIGSTVGGVVAATIADRGNPFQSANARSAAAENIFRSIAGRSASSKNERAAVDRLRELQKSGQRSDLETAVIDLVDSAGGTSPEAQAIAAAFHQKMQYAPLPDDILVNGYDRSLDWNVTPLIDRSGVWIGREASEIERYGRDFLDRNPVLKVALNIASLAFTVAGGPVKYAAGAAYDKAKGAIQKAIERGYADAGWDGNSAALGGKGITLAGSILLAGISSVTGTTAAIAGREGASVSSLALERPQIGPDLGLSSGRYPLGAPVLQGFEATPGTIPAFGPAKGWSLGDDIYGLTKSGNSPAWSTVRSRFWKNEAANPRNGTWNATQLDRMQRGLAPQRYNFDKGGIESMDLSHEPIPLRSGGRNVVPRWPQDHATVDPYRRPGY